MGKWKAFWLSSLALIGAASVTASAAVQHTGEYKPGEIIVKYKDGYRRSRMTMESIYGSVGVTNVKRMYDPLVSSEALRNYEQLNIAPSLSIEEAIETLQKNPAVAYAQPNYIIRALPVFDHDVASAGGGGVIPCVPGADIPGCDPRACIFPKFPPGCEDRGGGTTAKKPGPSPEPTRPEVAKKPPIVNPPVADPMLPSAYGISKIGSPAAWNTTKGSQNIVVAVIDTGVDYNHEDLSFNMWRNPRAGAKGDIVGWDFIHNDNLPFDDNKHGTHCAGTIGAVGGNGKGVSGVSQRVSIMALKFLSGQGSGDTVGAVKAIDYAVEHGAKVLSNSWGGPGGDEADDKMLRDAIERAREKDVLFVAAAGNESDNIDTVPESPAGLNTDNMLSVAATDDADALAYFSNYGVKTVHVAAPGVAVFSTVPGNRYAKLSGTSMACPHVAGAAALVWSTNPRMTYKEVKRRLMDTVDKVSSLDGKTITGGRINVARAVAK